MTLTDRIELFGATGSAIGREHRRRGRGGQDAAALARTEEVACAVVCDGCSSGAASEVGARLSARWIATHAPRLLRIHHDDDELAEAVVAGLAAHLGRVADDLADEAGRGPVVASMLLSTALVALLEMHEQGRAIVFGVGDGAVVVNDEVRLLGDQAVELAGGASAPPYPAYRLLELSAMEIGRDGWLAPRVHFSGRARDVERLAVATDGAAEIELRRGEALAGGDRIEGLAAIANDARLPKNPSLLQKRLFALAEVRGRLDDDATIAVIGRARPRATREEV